MLTIYPVALGLSSGSSFSYALPICINKSNNYCYSKGTSGYVAKYLMEGTMIILRIEHKVPNFEGWKKAFDNDPINRKQSGVSSYRIFQPKDDPNYVLIDLEFESLINAESTLTALHKLWNSVEGKVMVNPQTRILNVIESIDIK